MGNAMNSPWFRVERAGDVLRLTAGGTWTVFGAAAVDTALRRVQTDGARTAEIDAVAVEALDTTGAWLLLRTRTQLTARGVAVTAFRLPQTYAPLLEVIAAGEPREPAAVVTADTFTAFLERVGRATENALKQGLGILGYIGRITVEWLKTIYAPQRHFRFTATIHQIEQVGINALPIVGLLMFLIGVVLAYQGADQLKRWGAELLTVNGLGIGILRELGVLITAIIIAGRSGSAFTAEIGTMKVNEEIDAMQTMGLNVDDVLILPRVSGLVIALPLLTLYANVMALIGGAMMCYFDLGITVPVFIRQLHSAINMDTFLVGMIKAPVFAYVIGMVGCYEGLNVERNAASVGRLTTRAVVESVFLVIVLDAGFSILFSILRI
jgi:phospholipid/cholesterol/gamma-HCH transport system permease protein